MPDLSQGDIIKIAGFSALFLIISKNAFIRSTGMFHVCPFLSSTASGPLHIAAAGNNGISGTAICEQIKLIDPSSRSCSRVDRIPYPALMDISDAVQGIFEYD